MVVVWPSKGGTALRSESFIAVGCGWLGCQIASEFATDTVESSGPVSASGAETRELVVDLADHRGRR